MCGVNTFAHFSEHMYICAYTNTRILICKYAPPIIRENGYSFFVQIAYNFFAMPTSAMTYLEIEFILSSYKKVQT